MQPYFFPYLGYWQLMNFVDRFVIYDDVNYIRRGWINRNRILINGEPRYLTVPVSEASQNKKICDLTIDDSTIWRGKLLKSIEIAYKKSKWFDEVFPVLQGIVLCEERGLADYLRYQLVRLADFLDIDTVLIGSSRSYVNDDMHGQARILDICRREESDIYVNAEGGFALYDSMAFDEAGVALQFIRINPKEYQQRAATFVPNLSIIDVLMGIGRAETRGLLANFSLIE
jgi:WbqC-like protein family